MNIPKKKLQLKKMTVANLQLKKESLKMVKGGEWTVPRPPYTSASLDFCTKTNSC
jgi:hypothetical protein